MVAVAVVGLYFGNVMIRRETAISYKIRESVFNFWELAALPIYCFMWEIHGFGKDHLTLTMIVFVFAAVLIVRSASAYPILAEINHFIKDKIPLSWKHM